MSLTIADLVDYTTFAPSGSAELAMDLSDQRITGARVVAEWVVRAWLQPRGGNPAARGRGTDIRRLENATVDADDLDRWRQALIAEARQVEYVVDCAVLIILRNRTVMITSQIVLEDGGSYALMVGIADAGKVVVNFGAAQ